jgi:putative Ca2+/H+ antiporter (TMEM165/GDT1 family)
MGEGGHVSATVHRWAGILLALLGTVHTALAVPSLAKGPEPDAVWFAGTGLAMVLLVVVNVACRRGGSRDVVTRRLTHAANLGFLAFGAVAVAAVHERQAYAIVVLLAAQAIAAFALPHAQRP